MLKRCLIGLVVLATGGIVTWYLFGPGAQASEGAGTPTAPNAQSVSVLTLEPQTISVKESLPGRIAPHKQSQIRPQVDGIITQRLFEEGTHVEKGQQLYQIDDARYEAALARAQANLKRARARVDALEPKVGRYEELVAIDAVSKQGYDDVKARLNEAKADMDVAQAAIRTAKVNLDYTKVYAPISGKISRSYVTEGGLVTANQERPLATVTQLDPIYVDIQQSGTRALEMRANINDLRGIPVALKLGESHDLEYEHEGRLKLSEVTVDESAGSVTLRAVVPNPDGVLLPGLFVRTVLSLGEKEEVMLVPQRATVRTPEGDLRVWVVDSDNVAHSRLINSTMAHQSSWVVTEGISQGDTIIVEGYQKVTPDAEVAPSPWERSETTSSSSEG